MDQSIPDVEAAQRLEYGHVNATYLSSTVTSPNETNHNDDRSKLRQGRWVSLIIFAIYQLTGAFQIAYIFSYTNQIMPALLVKYNV
jgi:hypothetical protein